MSTDQPVDSQTIEETKQQIRGLIGEITSLSRQDVEPHVYYGEFLQRVVTALAANGGAIWILRRENELALSYQINLRQAFPDNENEGEDRARHARLLNRVLKHGEHLLVPPYSGAVGDDEAGNPTSFLLVLVPIRDDAQVSGVIEIFQRPTSGPASQRGYLSFLSEMAQHFGQYLRSRRLRELADWQSLFSEVDRFSRVVHDTLDPKEAAYTIANEGRRLIGCDRVSVALNKGRKCVVEAVSGQDTMDTRSNAVVLLSKLATAVVRSGEPLWYTGSAEDLPPQIEEAVHNYVDETHTKTVAVLPLKRPEEDTTDTDETKKQRRRGDDRVVGALIVEQIEDSRPRADFAQSVDLVTQHSSRALANAVEHNNLFLMPLWRQIGKAKWLIQARTLPKTLAVLAGVLALIAALLLIPKDFNMRAKGKIQPRERREIFADVDGTIKQVEVQHGQLVKEGQVLAHMENPDLATQLTQIRGELRIARTQYASFQGRLSRDNRLEPAERSQLGVESARLREHIEALELQQKLRETEIKSLTVISPITGQVITWDVEQLLMYRPVARGNVLMTVANPDGPWELELFMEEDRMGHVRRAFLQNPQGPLKVSYILASNPKQKLKGQLYAANIQDLAQIHDEFGHSVRLIVEVDREDVKDALPGTEVTAKILCGRRRIGYVWFHELIEFLQAKVFF